MGTISFHSHNRDKVLGGGECISGDVNSCPWCEEQMSLKSPSDGRVAMHSMSSLTQKISLTLNASSEEHEERGKAVFPSAMHTMPGKDVLRTCVMFPESC